MTSLDQPIAEWLLGAPMLAIEVVSPGNTAEEIDGQVAAYLEEGAAEVWVIYPKTASIMVFRTDAAIRVTGEYWCYLVGVTIKLPALLAT